MLTCTQLNFAAQHLTTTHVQRKIVQVFIHVGSLDHLKIFVWRLDWQGRSVAGAQITAQSPKPLRY